MINQPDTIYEIRYDFDLDGAEISIPEGCILKFNGGRFLNALNIKGDVENKYLMPEWFGASNDGKTDSSDAFNAIVRNGNYKYTIYLLCGENIPIAKRVFNMDITDSDKGKTPYFYINPGKNYGFEVYRESPNGKKEVVVGFSSVNDVETLSFQDFSDCALIGEHDSTWSSMKTSVLLWKPVKDDIPDKTLYPHFFYNQGVLVSTSGNLKSPLTDFLAIPYLNVGVTSQRPGNADNGFQFFDVTLRKPMMPMELRYNVLLIIYSMKNNILGAVVYLSTAIVFSSSTALLMLFIKENSDRCHYYNGKWNKKDLAIGISSIILGSIAKYFITLI